MIYIYFGAPGSGKTTHAAYISNKRSIRRRYKNIYSNVPIKGTTLIDSADIGIYAFSQSLIIIDEASICWNNRKFKSFPQATIQYLKLHRHYKADILIYSQSYDDMDITVRRLADRLFIVKRGLLRWFTHVKPVKKKIDIDDNTKQIIDAFLFVPFGTRIFFNPPAWKRFDSWEAPYLPEWEDVDHKKTE